MSSTHSLDPNVRLAAPLKVGLVGAGYITQWHAAAINQHPDAELVAIADVNVSAAKQAAETFGIANHFASVEAMLNFGGLDVVHVLVPPDAHAAVTSQCIAAKVNVFLEKPMATSSLECDELLAMADRHGVRLGINHNFLFARVYEDLRQCIDSGKLGRIDAIDIAWNKQLPQLNHGPYSIWMLRDSTNLLLELGPHIVSPVLDLASFPDQITGIATHPIALPCGRSMMRNWAFSMTTGRIAVQTRLSLGSGMTEFTIHVRGSHGSATADIEDNTFTLNRATRYSMDFDRYHRLKQTSRDLHRQAKSGLHRYIGSKLGLAKHGNPYGESIANAITDYYQSLLSAKEVSSRLSGALGKSAIELCEQLDRSVIPPLCKDDADAGHRFAAPTTNESVNRTAATMRNAATENSPIRNGTAQDKAIHHATTHDENDPNDDPNDGSKCDRKPCLVFGGSGFIGQALVERLTEQGRPVRCFVRRPDDVPAPLRHPLVELVRGDMANDDDVARSLQGVDGVFHLARGVGKTWQDYLTLDIQPTQQLAKQCLAHRVGRLVYTSSIDAYYAGSQAGTITETTPLDPRIEGRNLYAKSKAVIEDDLARLHRDEGLDVVITRPGIVIGKGGSPFHWGIGMWTGESFCQIWGDGNHKLPLVLVDDVADGLIAAMDQPGIDGESFNFVADPVLTAREYLNELQRVSNICIDIKPTRIWHFYLTDMAKWMVKTAVRHPDRRKPSYYDWESRTQKATFDCSRSKQVLRWQPHSDRQSLIQRGIEDAIDVSMA
ncbi:oxidoreductase, Gfo/Idh/MocA family protein [Rhodopirellula maiorica SM1]|uniref:Oxidoreductase, Gfo/Idh/MocA family protein n=1 Tax=Rhodopirellula maiorica SM1 TaxID=1265738 RepID=M5RN22_9BACT|nr:NAD-dependent epimerase/dehydratase family protein [Rhodopirellula maiorica]EMI16777.1 oxidoreductase, Gfo/Idh/MocA family protein [Rhodopirellula maiorica SM1]